MNTTLIWLAVGLVTAVIVYLGWRWLTTAKQAFEESQPPILADSLVTMVEEPAMIHESPPVAMGIGEPDEVGAESLPAQPEEDILRLDAAVPPRVEVGRAFDMAVALRQVGSSLLAEEDLTQVKSGPVAITWTDEAARATVTIRVTAPDCDIDEAEQSVSLGLGQDEPSVYFLLMPRST